MDQIYCLKCKKQTKTNQGKLNDIPHIEFTLNPSGNFIHKYKNWAKRLINNTE